MGFMQGTFDVDGLQYSLDHDFPCLLGTVKQVQWASYIRACAHIRLPEETDRWIPYILEASWWIENRTRLRYPKIWRELSKPKLLEDLEELAETREGWERKRALKRIKEKA